MCKSQVKYNRMIRSLVGMIELILVLMVYRCACFGVAGCDVKLPGSLEGIQMMPCYEDVCGRVRCAMVVCMLDVFWVKLYTWRSKEKNKNK